MDNNINIIISKFLQNQCSKSEIDYLKRWVKKSSKNRKYFEQMISIWDVAKIAKNPDNINVDEQWDEFNTLLAKRINKNNKNIFDKKRSKLLARIVSVAAIIILSIGISWTYYYIYNNSAKSNSVKMLELIVPKGSKSILKLADGTKIWLNAETVLRYPEKFSDHQRDVYLDGEAYFTVSKNKNWPFKVHTSDLDIVVVGTSFNVKSYPGEGTIETTLEEGTVIIERISESGAKQSIKMKPKQRITLVKEKGKILLSDLSKMKSKDEAKIHKRNSVADIKRKAKFYLDENTDTELYIAWKNNRLIFKNERFESLAIKLERWYNVDIIIKNEKLKDYQFTGTFENETIEQAIKALQLTTKFNYKFEKNRIIIN